MKTVVVVDDDRVVARMHADMLEVLGYAARAFRSPTECLEWLMSNRADLGLFDLSMPGTDGVDLLEQIHDLGGCFPVVFITGNPDSKLANEARTAGAAGVFAKPLSMEGMLMLMDRWRAGASTLPVPHET